MPRLAANADDYAATRVGIFFPANNQTPADGNLTGQCVTLNKWFLAEMTDVPSPFNARGDARYVGDTLVNQGHAYEVAYDQRKRGDFVVYKYGTYGHIGVLLSGDRLFEQNVNVGGVARRLVDGAYVYAARIGSLNESWRSVRPNIYRIKTYIEEGTGMVTISNEEYQDLKTWKAQGLALVKERDTFTYPTINALRAENAGLIKERDTVSYPRINAATTGLGLPSNATDIDIANAISKLKADADNTGNESALQLIIDEKQRQLDEVTANFVKLAKENTELKAQLAASNGDTELLNGFGLLLSKLIARLGLKK